MKRDTVINVILFIFIMIMIQCRMFVPVMIGAALFWILLARIILAVRKSKKSKEDERKKW